jgi:hypothetical protein
VRARLDGFGGSVGSLDDIKAKIVAKIIFDIGVAAAVLAILATSRR